MSTDFKVVGYHLPTRLDRVLREIYKGLTQSNIEKLARKGQIKVNGIKARPKLRVLNDDIINIENFNFAATASPLRINTQDAQNLAKKIKTNYKIFEDSQILVINKPAGLAVQGGSKVKISIDDALKYLNQLGGSYKITHRLDKDTSGLLIIAKNKASAAKIAKAFEQRIIKKIYLAILEGTPAQASGLIESNIGKTDSKYYQKIVEHDAGGKLAITSFKIIKSLGEYCLVEFTPLTGRMHQLRVHAKSLECPIIGDNKYGSHKTKYANLFLHASSIELPHDILDETSELKSYKFEALIPDYWHDLVRM